MRSKEELLRLITEVAASDERIKAAVLSGSRTDPDAVEDVFQDFDVVYYVDDVAPFYNNMAWIEKNFGRPAVCQLPELGTLPGLEPDGDGHFTYLMLFDDHNRIDLTIDYRPYIDDGEPVEVLLDKCGLIPELRPDPGYWHVRRPGEKQFRDCCNEFWWCMNNVGKGAARDERPYAMKMFNCYVRDMLDVMTGWYIGVLTGFSVSPGKLGKYFSRHLPRDVYDEYLSTYSDAEPERFRKAAERACGLFSRMAREVAAALRFEYDEREERNMLEYLRWTRMTATGEARGRAIGRRPEERES